MATLYEKKSRLKDLKEEIQDIEKMTAQEICEEYNVDPKDIPDLIADLQHEIDDLEEEVMIEEVEEEEIELFNYKRNKRHNHDTI